MSSARPASSRARVVRSRASRCRRRAPRPARIAAGEDVLRDRQVRAEVDFLVDGADAQLLRVHAASAAGSARPVSSMLPASGAYTPVSTLISVDLPAPFWPISACTSPARRRESTPASACTPGKARAMPRASSTIAASSRSLRVSTCASEVLACAVSIGNMASSVTMRFGIGLPATTSVDRGHELRPEQRIALDRDVELAGDHRLERALHARRSRR